MSQNMPPFVQMFLSMMTAQVPLVIASLLGLVVVLTRWRQASRGAVWAVLGFGLSLVLCFAIPLLQAALQQWMMHAEMSSRAGFYTASSLLWTTLRAGTYVLLLVAIFAGRPLPEGTRL
jgi:hypothetical protein